MLGCYPNSAALAGRLEEINNTIIHYLPQFTPSVPTGPSAAIATNVYKSTHYILTMELIQIAVLTEQVLKVQFR